MNVGEANRVRACLVQATPVYCGPKPSRREQRRARKAAKNLHMWKTFRNRPWHVQQYWCYGDMCEIGWDALGADRPWPKVNREPSGFKAMSQLAEGMRK